MGLEILFVGASCSGKTTLSRLLAENLSLARFDVVDIVLKYLPRKNNGEINQETLLSISYDELLSILCKNTFQIVEIASDYPEKYVPKIVDALRRNRDCTIVLVFLYAPLDECLDRNLQRSEELQAPVDLIHEHFRYSKEFFEDLAARLEIGFICIETGLPKGIEDSYQELVDKIAHFKY